MDGGVCWRLCPGWAPRLGPRASDSLSFLRSGVVCAPGWDLLCFWVQEVQHPSNGGRRNRGTEGGTPSPEVFQQVQLPSVGHSGRVGCLAELLWRGPHRYCSGISPLRAPSKQSKCPWFSAPPPELAV